MGRKEFQKYSMSISNHIPNNDARNHHTWTVPALFNPLLFIIDSPYFKDDQTSHIVQNSNARQNNVEFVLKQFPESSSDSNRRYIKYVGTLRNIEKREKLCNYLDLCTISGVHLQL